MQDSNQDSSKRRRKLQTPWRVKAADTASRTIITIGGVGTIVAMSLLAIMLVVIVLPLFHKSTAEPKEGYALELKDRVTLHMGVDEYRTLAWTVCNDGTLQVIRLADGEVITDRVLSGGEKPTAMSFPLAGEAYEDGATSVYRTVIASGYANGDVQLFNVDIQTRYLGEDDVPEAMHEMTPGVSEAYEDGIVERTPTGLFRKQRVVISGLGPRKAALDGPVLAMDHTVDNAAKDGLVRLIAAGGTDAKPQMRFLRGGIAGAGFTSAFDLPYQLRQGQHARFIKLARFGSQAYAIWPEGTMARISMADDKLGPTVAQEVDTTPLGGETVTAARWLLGGSTLVVGTSEGRLSGYFTIRPDDYDVQEEYEQTDDGIVMVEAKLLTETGGEPITSIDSASRARLLVCGDLAGVVRVLYVTSEEQLIEVATESGLPIGAVTMSPKGDAFFATNNTNLNGWKFDAKHPEATWRTLFAPIWYENYAVKLHMWQSTGGSDDYEPKYGLVPLIFGSLKATIYGMLFGAPVALMAAVFTSEFMPPRWKARIKPTIELMASLPSVVLGFLAALVFAPHLEKILPAVMTMVFVIPLTFMLGAYLWQLLPFRFTVIARPYRFMAHLAVLPVGIGLSLLLGPVVESLLFGGNIKLWLNGSTNGSDSFGSPWGGWVYLLFPLAVIAVGLFVTTVVNPMVRARTPGIQRRPAAMIELIKFVGGLAVALLLAVGVGFLLTSAGMESRAPWSAGGFDLAVLGRFDQRNALLIGWVLGFAIIPIIYTIAEDALSSVPEHLRSGSLGSGATPWQTAIRIVVPTAMSGLFSALMIGLGRAVGETMIVLMAFGNTPLLDLNIFSGGRTLASNIAVELPEAPINSSHYRILFMCGLVLFVMTFILNTVAELVRMRFRKRSGSL